MLNAPDEVLQKTQVENGLGHCVLRSSLYFVLEPANLLVHVRQPRICSHTNHEAGSVANRISTQIETAVEAVHDVDQTDGIHIEHSSCVRIIAHLRRIAGNANQVADPDRGSSQQITLDAQDIAVTTSVMQDRIDSNLALNEQRKILVAHAGRRSRAV